VGDAAVVRRVAIADLELQRGRLAAVARLLLERGMRGEGVAIQHIEDAIAVVAARLAT
jgi:hypothetical protein